MNNRHTAMGLHTGIIIRHLDLSAASGVLLEIGANVSHVAAIDSTATVRAFVQPHPPASTPSAAAPAEAKASPPMTPNSPPPPATGPTRRPSALPAAAAAAAAHPDAEALAATQGKKDPQIELGSTMVCPPPLPPLSCPLLLPRSSNSLLPDCFGTGLGGPHIAHKAGLQVNDRRGGGDG